MVSLPELLAPPSDELHTDEDLMFYQLGMPGRAFANRARRTANLPAQREATSALNEMSLQAFLSEQQRETYSDRLGLAGTARDSLARPATTLDALLASQPGSEAGVLTQLLDPGAQAAADSAIQAKRVQDAQPSGSGYSGPTAEVEILPSGRRVVTIEGNINDMGQYISGDSIADNSTQTTTQGNSPRGPLDEAVEYQAGVGGSRESMQVELLTGETVAGVAVISREGVRIYYENPETGRTEHQDMSLEEFNG